KRKGGVPDDTDMLGFVTQLAGNRVRLLQRFLRQRQPALQQPVAQPVAPAVGVAELLEWRSSVEMARSGVPLISAQLSVGKIKQGVRFSLGCAEPARLVSRAPIQLIGVLESAQPPQHPCPEVRWPTLEATGPLALHLR